MSGSGSDASGVRLAELLASLSLATDLGLGQPQEHVLRQTMIATRLGAVAGFSPEERAATFYVSLLAMVGCVSDSHELGRWFGDDTGLRAASYGVDRAGLPMMRFLLGQLAPGSATLERLSVTGRFLAGGLREVMRSMAAHCETTGQIADRLGVAESVSRALPQALERWDGKGGPRGLTGERIERVMRVVQVANDAEVLQRTAGTPAALEMLRERRGTEFDPALVDLCVANSGRVFAQLDGIDAWAQVIAGCAPLDRELTEAELSAALETLGDYADLKSPWFSGHSRALSVLGSEAAQRAGLPGAEVRIVREAALVCRLGVIGVSAATWEHPGSLSAMEWERVRTVPYLTERILRRQPRLAELATLAGMLHERLDGSGYPRGVLAASIPAPARLLAAAEVYQACREARPQRPAMTRSQALAVLRREAAEGRLDGQAVEAVLAAAGHQPRRRPSLVGGLSQRELEVLRLIVRGRSNRQIAAALSISARTVASHVEHVYTKIGVSTRGSAAMYAMRHGLIDATSETDDLEQNGESIGR